MSSRSRASSPWPAGFASAHVSRIVRAQLAGNDIAARWDASTGTRAPHGVVGGKTIGGDLATPAVTGLDPNGPTALYFPVGRSRLHPRAELRYPEVSRLEDQPLGEDGSGATPGVPTGFRSGRLDLERAAGFHAEWMSSISTSYGTGLDRCTVGHVQAGCPTARRPHRARGPLSPPAAPRRPVRRRG